MHSLLNTAAILALSAALAACGETGPDPLANTTAAPFGAPMAMGNDEGSWPSDGECDDMRFQGRGVAGVFNADNIGRDATDCQALLSAGEIEPNPLYATPENAAAIAYGDDAGSWPNDNECDDVRFTGDYAAELIYFAEEVGHDASDCRAAVEAGAARWQGNTATPELGATEAAEEPSEAAAG